MEFPVYLTQSERRESPRYYVIASYAVLHAPLSFAHHQLQGRVCGFFSFPFYLNCQ